MPGHSSSRRLRSKEPAEIWHPDGFFQAGMGTQEEENPGRIEVASPSPFLWRFSDGGQLPADGPWGIFSRLRGRDKAIQSVSILDRRCADEDQIQHVDPGARTSSPSWSHGR
jgi:hypothetical protein